MCRARSQALPAVAADLMCDAGFDGGACAAERVGSAGATGEERALADAVGDVLRGCDRGTLEMMEAAAPTGVSVWPAAAGGGAGAPAPRRVRGRGQLTGRATLSFGTMWSTSRGLPPHARALRLSSPACDPDSI